MNVSFKIRKYRDEDRDCCRSLWKELTEWHRKIYQDLSIGGEHPEDYFDKHLTKVGPDNLWVATYDDKPVGLMGLIVEEHEAEIEPLIVNESHRGKGIGTRLVETAVSEARNREMRYLDVKPVARNAETIRFLNKLGFKNLGQIEMFTDFSKHTWKPGIKIHECEFSY
jgi:GNAT superfamily N-acetyltransferase